MKVERILVGSNDNILYYPFWNIISKVYSENFGIKSTLMWHGIESDIDTYNLSKKYGDIIVLPIHPEYQIPWQTTWGYFYGTKFYPNEVCMTIGIDEILLSGFINQFIKNLNEDAYITVIDDAYSPSHWEKQNGTSPTAYHIAKGKTFNKVYEFDDNFLTEIEKVYQSKDAFWSSGEDKWGIDESYSSKKLRQYRDCKGEIISLSKFSFLQEKRINCRRTQEVPYDLNLLQAGLYSEIHCCRPYPDHKDYIDTLVKNIPKFI